MKDTRERTSEEEEKKNESVQMKSREEEHERRERRPTPLWSCSCEGRQPWLAWAAASAAQRHTTGLNGRFVILQRLSAPEGLLQGTGVTTSGPPALQLAARQHRHEVLAGSVATLGISFDAFSTREEEVFFVFFLTGVHLGKTKDEARAVAHSEAGDAQLLLVPR